MKNVLNYIKITKIVKKTSYKIKLNYYFTTLNK